MTDPTELLACPFCSGVAHIADDLITFYGECGTCGATSDYSSYKAGAVAKWNRRTPTPQPTQGQAGAAADALEAQAREIEGLRKQDDALILQLVKALEWTVAPPCMCWAGCEACHPANPPNPVAAIAAGRARLEGKP